MREYARETFVFPGVRFSVYALRDNGDPDVANCITEKSAGFSDKSLVRLGVRVRDNGEPEALIHDMTMIYRKMELSIKVTSRIARPSCGPSDGCPMVAQGYPTGAPGVVQGYSTRHTGLLRVVTQPESGRLQDFQRT